MKMRKVKILFGAILLLFGVHASFAEKAFGFDIGEKVHWSENGRPYNAHCFAASLDFSGETFGIKPFFSFSFSTINASNMNNSTVTYNYKDTTFVETLGIKPYFIFRKGESSNSYIGLLFALNFNQKELETTKVTANGTDITQNYTTGELGLFVGNKWHASEKCTVFAECDFSSRLFASTSTYELGGKSVENYQSGMFGGGGTSSWSLYVTPRLGIAYRW